MTEVLFCLSVGFVAYVFYVLVDEQMGLNTGAPQQPVLTVEPSKIKASRKTATVSKGIMAKKGSGISADVVSDPILSYLSKNGLTTVAKLSRELPENRKTIEERIGLLIQEGVITQAIVRRAKTVALKS
jgi:predicted HTH transcriptional regulator